MPWFINDVNEQGLMQKVMDGQTEVIHFLIEDDDLLEKYSATCNKVSTEIKK